jgi:probable HAF family extracellular repeat protein
MLRYPKHLGRWTAIAVVIGLVCSADILAKKPDKPPSGGDGDKIAPYTFVDLLGLPSNDFLQSDAHSVSEPDADGALFVAGNSRVAGEFFPVLWSLDADGSFADPLNLGGPASHREAEVNDAGIVATFSGSVFVPGRDRQQLPAPGSVAVHATDINNSDQIAGYVVYDDGITRYGTGALWTLDQLGGVSGPILLDDDLPEGMSFIPQGISDTGVMAGELVDMAVAAIAWFEGDVLQIEALGTLPGFDWSGADAISSDGAWVAGTCRREGPWQAFLWSATTGEMTGLLGLVGEDCNSHAWDVNSAGHVVGTSDTGEGRYSMTAVLWQGGQVFDLNTLTDAGNKAHLAIPKAINDTGHIVGLVDYSRPLSEMHGYLLIPNPQ